MPAFKLRTQILAVPDDLHQPDPLLRASEQCQQYRRYFLQAVSQPEPWVWSCQDSPLMPDFPAPTGQLPLLFAALSCTLIMVHFQWSPNQSIGW